MKYTINGKEYSELDINKRCAELMGVISNHKTGVSKYEDRKNDYMIATTSSYYPYGPYHDVEHTWPIIEKCWDELNKSILRNGGLRKSHWQATMQKHKCTKLVAACICFIDDNETLKEQVK